MTKWEVQLRLCLGGGKEVWVKKQRVPTDCLRVDFRRAWLAL